MVEFLLGVDGGGSGTRVRLARADGSQLSQGTSGPSALMHGAEAAWKAVGAAAAMAYAQAGMVAPPLHRVAIGLGLAGVHNRQWAAGFLAAQPGYAAVALETDALTTLLGAHQGQAGAIVAIGTGSVGELLDANGQRREVGGWGFPSGDEAGGAWIGLRAVNHAQQVLDGRAAGGAFADAVIAACGGARDAVQTWLAQANQHTYAELAPLVLAHGADAQAHAILSEAGRQVALLADALDAGDQVPVALCGGLAAPLTPYLPASLRQRVVSAQGDSATGALRLIARMVARQPADSPRSPLRGATPC